MYRRVQSCLHGIVTMPACFWYYVKGLNGRTHKIKCTKAFWNRSMSQLVVQSVLVSGRRLLCDENRKELFIIRLSTILGRWYHWKGAGIDRNNILFDGSFFSNSRQRTYVQSSSVSINEYIRGDSLSSTSFFLCEVIHARTNNFTRSWTVNNQLRDDLERQKAILAS